MPGVAPKDLGKRRRTNKPARGDWVDIPVGLFEGDRPLIPTKLIKVTRETWERWWGSPQAHMWMVSEWQVVRRAIRLVDKEERGLASGEDRRELRQLEDALGLSRKGLQDRRWRLPDEDEPQLAVVKELKRRVDPRKK